MTPTFDDITVTFAKRQTPESRFSHFEGSDDELVRRILDHWDDQKPGYREGVILVPVVPEGFFSGVIQLHEGDMLEGTFEARRSGEEPRKSIVAEGVKMPAVGVDVVLYHRDVLAEEEGYETSSVWEVISINARTTEEEQPMEPETMMANHFGASGGTATGMTPEEFEKALRESYEYWKDKCLIRPS